MIYKFKFTYGQPVHYYCMPSGSRAYNYLLSVLKDKGLHSSKQEHNRATDMYVVDLVAYDDESTLEKLDEAMTQFDG